MKKLNVFVFKKWIVNFCIVALVILCGFAVYLGVTLNSSKETSSKSLGEIRCGDTSSNKISLMINVCWGEEYLADMLDILDEKGVKVTFFVGGVWAADNEELVIDMVERGHELGNHAYSHKDHDKLTKESSKKEISTTHNLVKSICGKEMTLFAPPSGAFNANTVAAANELGYKTILWTRDTIDWRDQDENKITSRAVENAKGGDLILMHPTECTLKALGNIIDSLKGAGFSLVSVSENLSTLNS